MTRIGPKVRRQVRELIRRDGNHCLWCGRVFDGELAGASVDHVIPRQYGGCRVLANAILACRDCNSERGCRSARHYLAICEADPLRCPDTPTILAAIRRSRGTPNRFHVHRWETENRERNQRLGVVA